MAQKINTETQEEEVEEEPADNPLCRQKRSDSEQQEDGSGPVKDNTPTPHSKAGDRAFQLEAVAPVLPEPVMELHILPG